MTEEIKKEEEKKCCCACEILKSESFKKFLVVALGTFVGMFCAMSLFFALHKPPMMHHGHHFRHGGPHMERHMGHHHHHFKGHDFKGGQFKPDVGFEKLPPADEQKPEME